MSTTRPTLAYALATDDLRQALFSDDSLARLTAVSEQLGDGVLTEFESDASLRVLRGADILITGWGCPPVDATVLERAPRLRLIAHSAGSVKDFLGAEVWGRGIRVTTAAGANARPVAEYTLAMILLAGKDVLGQAARFAREQGGHADAVREIRRREDLGNFGRTIGIVGASLIGRRVLELLRPFDFRVLVFDPTVTVAQAAELGAELVGLDELMSRSDVVSLHAPVLESTRGMIGRAQLAAMRDGATLINTARGALVDHDILRTELQSGRISAVLDVTSPEPLPTGDPLYSLPNVLLTPHLAGSQGNELFRLGESVVDEVERFVTGRPARHLLTLDAMTGVA